LQAFYDAGTHGDAVVGDDIYSFQATATLITKPLVVAIYRAENEHTPATLQGPPFLSGLQD